MTLAGYYFFIWTCWSSNKEPAILAISHTKNFKLHLCVSSYVREYGSYQSVITGPAKLSPIVNKFKANNDQARQL